MEIEPRRALHENPDVECARDDGIGFVAEQGGDEVAVENGRDGESRKALLDFMPERGEDLFGEEVVQRCRHRIGVGLELGGRDARESDDCRPAVRDRDEARGRRGSPVYQQGGCFLEVHRERSLVHLEDVAVQDALARHPRRTLAPGDEELDR